MQYYAISNSTSHFSNFSRFLTNFDACRSGGVKDSQSQTDQLPPDCTLVFFLQEILFTRNLIVYKRLCPAVGPSVGPMVHEQESKCGKTSVLDGFARLGEMIFFEKCATAAL